VDPASNPDGPFLEVGMAHKRKKINGMAARTVKQLQGIVRSANQFVLSGRKAGALGGGPVRSLKLIRNEGLSAAAELRKRRRK